MRIDQEAWKKNTTEQYEMLGRFVEAFELMVNEVRELCLFLAARDGRNAILVQTILHHQVFTAKPLFDVLRALIAEAIKDALQEIEDRKNGVKNAEPPLLRDALNDPLPLTIQERDDLFSILTFIAKHYDDLCNQRNDLLHGTWFVGYISEVNPHSAEFFINRLKATKSGLSPVTGLPKTAAELKGLAERCEDVRLWIGFVEEVLKGDVTVSEAFKFDMKTWWLVVHPGEKRTLQAQAIAPPAQ
jgi:hypothetical protein